MDIPLPNAPAGSFMEGAKQANALAEQSIANEIENVKARYAPITTLADAASKLTYSSLMGPQALAKFMGHPDILANMSEPQRKQALDIIYNAGTGQSGGFGGLNPLNIQQMATQQEQSPFAKLVGGMRNALGLTAPQSQQQPEMAPQQPQSMGGGPPSDTTNALNAWMQSPEAQRQAQTEGLMRIPEKDQLMDWYGKQGATQENYTPPPLPKTWPEKTGEYLGIKEEGQEAGKIRAQDIKELNDSVFSGLTKQATLDDINNMIASPEIREIRQLPLLGRHEMGWYAKEGSPAQQQLVGRLYAQMGNIIKDSSRDFSGQFRRGEQQLLQGMKPSDSDTVDTMIGKAESLSTMNQLLVQRSKLTSQYMNQYHINKGQAAEIADKQVNADAIRSQIHNKLNPKSTDMVKVQLPDGSVKSFSRDGATRLIKDYPDHKIIG